MATSATAYLLLLSSYYYMLYQMGYQKIFVLSAVFLVLPLSDGYFEFILLALMYLPFLFITFLAVGMLFQYVKSAGKVKGLILVAISGFAFCVGLGGVRHVVILYLPILMTAIVLVVFRRRHYDCLIGALAGFFASGIGYLINTKVLSNIYHFMSWGDVGIQKFTLKNIGDLFTGILRFFGYSHGTLKTPILSGFSCILFIFMIFCLCRGIFRKEVSSANRFLSLYMVCAFGILLFIYMFTNMLYSDRYSMTILILSIPLMVMNIEEAGWNKGIKAIVGMILVGGIVCGCIFRYMNYSKYDTTKGLREVSNYLQEEEIDVGYATFWNANILTELSDGYVDVYCWTGEEVGEVYQWLQVTDHAVNKPKGRLFLMFSRNEYENSSLKVYLDEEKCSFNSEEYIVFIFNNYKDMLDKLSFE